METDRGPSGSQAGADTVLPLPMVQQQTQGTTSGQVSVSVGYPGCQHSAPVLSITLRQLSTYTHLVTRGAVRNVESQNGVNERVIFSVEGKTGHFGTEILTHAFTHFWKLTF